MFRCRMGKKTVPGGRKIYTLVLHPDKKKPDTVQWNDTERVSEVAITTQLCTNWLSGLPDKKKPDTVQWNDTELTTLRSIEKKKTWARIGCRAFPTKN